MRACFSVVSVCIALVVAAAAAALIDQRTRWTQLTLDGELFRFHIPLDYVLETRVLHQTVNARLVHVNHLLALWTWQIDRVEWLGRREDRRRNERQRTR